MISGFNHNIQHKGQLYHIQTEDSGVDNPHIITLLYQSGTIIAKKKTSYQDLIHLGNKDEIIKELMEEQHKAMLRELIRGGFDEMQMEAPKGTNGTLPEFVREHAPAEKSEVESAHQARPVEEIKPDQIASLFGANSKEEKSLDEIILSYLSDES